MPAFLQPCACVASPPPSLEAGQHEIQPKGKLGVEIAVHGHARDLDQAGWRLARETALITDPPILLIDEPTLGLDVQTARTVKDWIALLASIGGLDLWRSIGSAPPKRGAPT